MMRIRLTHYFILKPPIIMFMVGGLSLILNLVFYSKFSSQHLIYLGGIVLCLLGYCVGSALKRLFAGAASRVRNYQISFSEPLLKVYTFLGVLGAVISAYLIISRGAFGPGGLFFNLRYATAIEHLPSYGAAHLGLFSLFASVIYLFRDRSRQSYYMLFLALLPSVAGMERTGILYSLLFYYYFYARKHGIKPRIVIFSLLLAFAFVLGFAALTNKLFGVDGEFFLLSYFSYGLEAFGERVAGNHFDMPASTVFGIFGSIYDLLSGRVIGDYSLDDEGIFNVYTYIYRPVFVLGEHGLLIMMFISGIFFQILEVLSEKWIYFCFLSASLIYPSVMIFYDWTFGLTTHLYMALVSLPLLLKFK